MQAPVFCQNEFVSFAGRGWLCLARRASSRLPWPKCAPVQQHPSTNFHGTVARCMAASAPVLEVRELATPAFTPSGPETRVRFAPSPTGNLHVGGARTALFNWLYAKKVGGKFILRIEDTDTARSTRESEAAVLRDLTWLGIEWDEGPEKEGPYGPYRQSERTAIYKQYVDQLVEKGLAYPCFCTDDEITAMKEEAERRGIPPIYRGKWAKASPQEVEEEMKKGTPYCYRFRVPLDRDVVVRDVVRGEVRFNTAAVGDFVILRSNGLPVYNFCVAIDDALMRVTHVLRAEEHLPNTLRQVLIYEAIGASAPVFGHMSLILAPDKSKLSKRHGATSVGEFREQGFLPQAMINYLSLLGWNDGTEKEIYQVEELQEAFNLDRITKSPAVFDKTKLGWMNGQHVRSLPEDQLLPLLTSAWQNSGLLAKPDSPFVRAALHVCQHSLELVTDADRDLRAVLSYPLQETLASDKAADVLADNFEQIATAVLQAYDSGELGKAASEGNDAFKAWAKALGKEQSRKGKRLFMPLRIALTGSMQGPEVGEVLHLLSLEDADVADVAAYVQLSSRMDLLRQWLASRS
eukprot:jgi/Botrbrau1/5824/Bobra.0366s0009.1